MDTETKWVCLYQKPPLTEAEATPHVRYACGLRELADWIEAHPEIALPNCEISSYSLDEREEAAAVLKALKPCRKHYSGEMFYIRRDFGPITLSYVFYRNTVCVAKVVGKKEIPEQTIPEQVIPAHTEDIIEWDCSEPILATKPEQAAA